jgi:hypothetical protein
VIRTRGKNHYLWRRREENAARDSNFRKVIEVGPALCCGRSFPYLGWHALLGANQALVQRRRAFRPLTANAARTWRPGALVQRSGGAPRLPEASVHCTQVRSPHPGGLT